MTREFLSPVFIVMLAALAACSNESSAPQAPAQMDEIVDEETASSAEGTERVAAFTAPAERPIDKFSYANYDEIRVDHVDLDLTISFENKSIDGVVTMDLNYIESEANRLILDVNNLTIKSVESKNNGSWSEAPYTIGADDPVMGSALEIDLEDRADKVRIAYSTSPDAEGLQWLEPAQTAGKTHPFLLSQFQPLNARTMAPLQDTPAVRFTYKARVKTPPALAAVMSASQDPDNERDGDYHFDMPQPVPAYLLALAVGDFEFKAINDHIGVYAEDYILDEAAEEFEDTPKMEDAIDALYGEYQWGRYDMIVLPPSFPFGGMENPRISFLTPTLIAGDKSLTNVVAHELAHSWSGNLVTNATWQDAWLNEGFTSYVENRVMEELYGEERAIMERALDLENLKSDIAGAARPALTALKMPDDLSHPDDAFSQVAYSGGMFFLKFLEDRFGRDAFDAFLKEYFNHFAFQSITTEEFLSYFEDKLWANDPDAVTKEEITAWIYEPGLPETVESPTSNAFAAVTAQQERWLQGEIEAGALKTGNWSTHEWLHFINTFPETITAAQLAEADAAFNLSQSQNAEIAFAWYMQAINADYKPAYAPIDEFLMRVGRGKFIYRLYAALIDNGKRDWAESIYARAKPGYHPIAQRRIDDIFANNG